MSRARITVLVILTVAIALDAPAASAADRILRAEMVLDAPVAAVWDLLSTEKGLTSFFAPGARIEPKVDGLFEIWFDPKAEPGKRGADGMRILAFEPGKRIVFTWNAPPAHPLTRAQRTTVEFRLTPAGDARTAVRFTHAGFGDGPEWDRTYDYFSQAWNGFVLPNLAWRVAHGPIDWTNRPQVTPVAATLEYEGEFRAAPADRKKGS